MDINWQEFLLLAAVILAGLLLTRRFAGRRGGD